jgi:hypothetical protein
VQPLAKASLLNWTTVTQKHSRPREQAEIAFAEAQSQFLARDRIVAGAASTLQAREKTLRLKQARLARESKEHPVASTSPVEKVKNA